MRGLMLVAEPPRTFREMLATGVLAAGAGYTLYVAFKVCVHMYVLL